MHNKSHLLLYAVSIRIALFTLTVWSATYLPLFDASPAVARRNESNSLFNAFLRWDAFHFTSVAMSGYTFEHNWAWFPGTPFLLRALSFLQQSVHVQLTPLNSTLLSGLLMGCCSLRSIISLYDLIHHITKSESTAYLVTFLSIFPHSPMVLHLAGYSESMFTVLSYEGMLKCAKQKWLSASIYFMLASAFRSNGILLVGFIVWGMLVQPYLTTEMIGKGSYRIISTVTSVRLLDVAFCVIYCTLVFIPFVAHQYHGWSTFCQSTTQDLQPSWCGATVPLIYGHVQAKYWNVGFLRYWTVSQIPNLLLPSPIIALIGWSVIRTVRESISVLNGDVTSHISHNSLLIGVLPHALHAAVLTSWILFAAHTQILLRLAPSMPFLYWSAARLVTEEPGWGKAWVYWSVTYGAVSVILWSTFLPPA